MIHAYELAFYSHIVNYFSWKKNLMYFLFVKFLSLSASNLSFVTYILTFYRKTHSITFSWSEKIMFVIQIFKDFIV